jgi:hypothetical protein
MHDDTLIISQGRPVGRTDETQTDNRPVYPNGHSQGLTKQEYFCLELLIPESGNPVLDRLIRKKLEGDTKGSAAGLRSMMKDREEALCMAYAKKESPVEGDTFTHNWVTLYYKQGRWHILEQVD